MTRYLVDTNVLVRLLDFSAADHLVAENVINQLLAQDAGARLYAFVDLQYGRFCLLHEHQPRSS